MHAAAADGCGAAENRKSSNYPHRTCLLQTHVDLQQILRQSDCTFRK